MIDLGATEFRFAAPTIAQAQLRTRTTELFDEWETYIHASLALPDYSLFLEVEEGSIKGGGAVAAALAALYFGIGNYGDFVGGLKTISEQLGSAGTFLAEKAPQVFGCEGVETKVRKRGGTLSGIQRLFVKVQRGELTAEEAMLQADGLLGDEASRNPGFMEDLGNTLRNCPRFHEQMPLLPVEEVGQLSLGNGAPQPRRHERQTPVLAPPLHLRIEVWRESKNKRKKSRVIQL